MNAISTSHNSWQPKISLDIIKYLLKKQNWPPLRTIPVEEGILKAYGDVSAEWIYYEWPAYSPANYVTWNSPEYTLHQGFEKQISEGSISVLGRLCSGSCLWRKWEILPWKWVFWIQWVMRPPSDRTQQVIRIIWPIEVFDGG